MAAEGKCVNNHTNGNRPLQAAFLFLLYCAAAVLFALPVSAAEPVFYFSSGREGTEKDGSAYREMEIMCGDRPAEASSIQMEEAWCRYYIPGDNSGRGERPGGPGFIPAVARIVPSDGNGRWTVRIVSPVRAACTVVAGFLHGGKRYVLQTQFNLYGHGWNAGNWRDSLRKKPADAAELPLPYLHFEGWPFFLTGQTVRGQYKNAGFEALPGEKGLPVQVFPENLQDGFPLRTDGKGRISFTVPLPAPLQNSVWRESQNRILAVTIPRGWQPVQLFTRIDIRDNYYAYDNVPHGIAVLALSAALTAAAVLFWQRRSSDHGY